VQHSKGSASLNCTSGFTTPPAPAPPHADAPLTVVLGAPELVIDTRGIVANTSNGLRRVPHRPQKMGRVVTSEHPWEAWLGFYNSVVQIFPSNMVHLYYGCAGPANATVTFLCLATSSDGGVSFTKPVVGLYAYNGSTQNNIVWSTPYELVPVPGGGGTNGGHTGTGWANSVLFDQRPGVPASERFKLLYDTDAPPFSGRHLLVATSSDGIRWTQLLMRTTPNGSLVDHSEFADTNTCLLWVQRLHRYVAFGRIDASTPGAICGAADAMHSANFRRVGVIFETVAVTAGRSAANATTPFADRDFNSVPASIFFNQPGIDPGCVDFYNPAAIDVAGATFIFPSATLHLQQPAAAPPTQPRSSFPSPYDSCRSLNDGFLDVRMAFSRMEPNQPLRFEQLGTAPVVARGIGRRDVSTGIYDKARSEWDAGMVFMGTGLVAAVGAEPGYVSQYYFGSQFTHAFEAYHLGQQYPAAQRGLGRVKWRQEGFVSLSSSYHLGPQDDAPSPNRSASGVLITRPILLSAVTGGAEVVGSAAARNPRGEPRHVEIALNVETSVSGHVVVELLDARTLAPLAGGYRSVPIVGNDVRAPVVWNASFAPPPHLNFTCNSENGPSAMPPAGSVLLRTDVAEAFRDAGDRGLRLRVTLTDADLYSITFQEISPRNR
jgi:hypothetical protein